MGKTNDNLSKAKSARQDEFYTTRLIIEDELSHYAEFFKDKAVYCNCDDPEWSEFWQFFKRNFKPWRLKSLVATHYETDTKNFAYKLELSEDTNGDGVIDWRDDPVITQLPCNGDFRNAACIELLDQADIVVTNPPFSLFREYVSQLIDREKKFLIIGNINVITYKEVFPLLMENKMWMGYTMNGTGQHWFRIPDNYNNGKIKVVDGIRYATIGGACWFTNLDILKRHQTIDLRGNYYRPEDYPKYDNYDAIEVSRVDNIPCDYEGVMGVPITFMNKYCPDQFEIIGITKTWFGAASKIYPKQIQVDKNGTRKEVTKLNDGPVLKLDGPITNKTYYVVGDGCYQQVYARVLIRNKNPEPRRFPDED